MAQTQNEKDALLCVYGDCRELQPEDGEYCEEHYLLSIKECNCTGHTKEYCPHNN